DRDAARAELVVDAGRAERAARSLPRRRAVPAGDQRVAVGEAAVALAARVAEDRDAARADVVVDAGGAEDRAVALAAVGAADARAGETARLTARHVPERRAHLVEDAARVVAVARVARGEARVARRAAVVVVRDGADPRVPAAVADAHAVHPRDGLLAVGHARDVGRADDHVDREVDRRRDVARDAQHARALAAQGVVVGAGVELDHAQAALAQRAGAVARARHDRAAAAVRRARPLARPGQLRPAVAHAR